MRGIFKVVFLAVVSLSVASAGAGSSGDSRELDELGSFNKYNGTGYAALWGYTAPDNREYAILGVRNGTAIVDITDSPNLREVAFINNSRSEWTEMKVYKNYAYVVKDNVSAGIQILDLSDLPRSARLVNTVRSMPQNHTLWIDASTGRMFTVGGSNTSVTVWDLADPVNPVVISEFNNTYVHDMYVRGNRAYLAEIFSKSFSIWDISDISQPRLIKRVRDPQAPFVSFHNAWTTDDGAYLVTTEESDGRPVRIWDIRDEPNPREVARWLGPGNIAHNVRVKGQFVHVAHYGGGYRVLDISNINAPAEVAHFNNKATNLTGMVGIWDVYPYFPSGKVIMSSIEDGLFVTRFDQ